MRRIKQIYSRIKAKAGKRHIAFAVFLFCLIIAAAAGTVLWHDHKTHVQSAIEPSAANVFNSISSSGIKSLADQVVQKCAQASYKPTCYETEIPKLMDTITMKDAFNVTVDVQQEDPSYQYCHVLGHKLAEQETAKDPSKWKEVIDMCPSGVCSNGCIHGAFQQRFRAESVSVDELQSLKPELQDICEHRPTWNPTGLEQATCYHALGHLLMYATAGNVAAAVQACDDLALKDNGQRDYRKLCYDGAFMQIFQPLEPDDFALVKGKQPTKPQLASFCAKFPGLPEVSCWNEGWPLYRSEILTPKGVVTFCRHLKTEQAQNLCFTDQFYVVTAQEQFDTSFMKNYCSQLPGSISGRCFANTASRLIETDYKNIDKSVSVCKSASLTADQTQCYQELLLYSTYNFQPGSPEFYKICNALGLPWKNQCLARAPT